MPLSVHVEFGGGAELLFEKVKHHDLTLPDQPSPWSLRNLIAWIRDNLLKVRDWTTWLYTRVDGVPCRSVWTCLCWGRRWDQGSWFWWTVLIGSYWDSWTTYCNRTITLSSFLHYMEGNGDLWEGVWSDFEFVSCPNQSGRNFIRFWICIVHLLW